jgi:DNA polymerase-3 subunit beta
MKVIFNRTSISAAVMPLMCAVSGKSTLTAIEGILIEAKFPDTCIMTTFDLEKGVQISVEAKVIEEGEYIVNAQKFVQTLRVMEGEEVTLTIDSKLCATMVSKRSSHKMNALLAREFPSILDLTSDRSFIVSQSVFKKMLQKVSFAMAANDPRVVLNGTFVKVDDDSVMMVSCDSFKLAKCRKKTELVNKNTNGKDFLDYKFIIPAKTVAELIRLLDDDEEATMQMYYTRKHIVFIIGDITFFSRLVEGEYIDYNRIINPSQRINVKVNRQELIASLERAALITEERIAGSVRAHVKLDICEDVLKINAVSSAGSTYDELFIEHDGDDIVIAFNNRYLIDSVRASTGEEIFLALSSPLTSMNILPSENDYEEKGEEELFMLLPVRMKEQ